MPLSIAFHGGAGTVTGSKFLVNLGNDRVLIDCGIFQGRKELRLQNWEGPGFDPRSVDAVVVTHAHIDHTGYLPILVRRGFRGPIFCTPATRELVEILLLDAAKLHEEDAAFANKHGFSKHNPALPLFDEGDARAALQRMKAIEFGKEFFVGRLRFRYAPAGHILGSAFVEMSAEDALGPTTIVFSGDIGRFDVALHADPDLLPPCDTLVMESTYGDRDHDHRALTDQLREALLPAIRRGAIILIPAFAVARVQLITLILRELIESRQLPEIPIHVDSPMAVDVTRIYNRYLHAADIDEDLPGASDRSLFPRGVRFHRSPQESKELNALRGPRIIISSSGMLAGGRVLHHLRRVVSDPVNLVVLAGFQAAGTRGRALEEGARFVRVHGMDVPVRAEVKSLHGFSAHADREALIRWATDGDGRPAVAFLVHGEPEAMESLAGDLRRRGIEVRIPTANQMFIRDARQGWVASSQTAESDARFRGGGYQDRPR